MSRDVTSDAGFLRNKDAIIGVAEQDILQVNTRAPVIRSYQNIIRRRDKVKVFVCLT